MAPAVIDPALLIVFRVVQHPQDVNDAPGVVHPADEPEAVVAHVEHDAVADLIGRPERLPERPEIGPLGVLGDLVPGGQVPFGGRGITFPGSPELPEPSPGDDAHATPDQFAGPPAGMIIAICDKSREIIARRDSICSDGSGAPRTGAILPKI